LGFNRNQFNVRLKKPRAQPSRASLSKVKVLVFIFRFTAN